MIRTITRKYTPDALSDLNEAIRLEPYHSSIFSGRSNYWKVNGRTDLATADWNRHIELESARKNNAEAMKLLFGTNTFIEIEEYKRKRNKTLEFAVKACETTDYKYYRYLGTLADAHYSLNNFDEAVNYISKALEYAPDEEKSDYRRGLKIAIFNRDFQRKNKKPATN